MLLNFFVDFMTDIWEHPLFLYFFYYIFNIYYLFYINKIYKRKKYIEKENKYGFILFFKAVRASCL